MSNLIQIKRSSVSSTPSSLANGEIAYSFASAANTLFIGDPRNVVPGTPLRIAGGKYSFLHQAVLQSSGDEGGILTANAVVITNANNFLDEFNTNTLVIGPDGTTNASATFVVDGTANITGNVTIGGSFTATGGASYSGNIGFDTDTLFIDATNNRVGILTTTPDAALEVNGAANIAGPVKLANTLTVAGNVTFSDILTVTKAATFSNTIAVTGNATFSNNVTVANIVSGLTVSNTFTSGNTTVSGFANVISTLQVGGVATFDSNTTTTGAAGFSNTIAVTGNATFSNTLAVTGLTTLSGNINTPTANASVAVNVGANVTVNTTSFKVGNSTVNTVITSTGIDTDGTLNVLEAAGLSNTLTVTGLTTLNGDLNTTTANASVGFNAGANVSLDTTRLAIGNSTVNTVITSTSINTDGTLDVLLATTLANTIAVTGNATFSNTVVVTGNATFSNTIAVTGGATFSSNVAVDTDVLYVDTTNNRVGILTTTPDAGFQVNGTANVVGNTTLVGKLTQVANATFSNTITVVGNATFSNTISVTGAAEFLNTITGSANVSIDSGVFFVDTVNNRVGVNDSTPDVAFAVTGDAVISANLTANNLLINADAVINGNLAINGTLTTIDTVNLVVEDPMFKLGKNNNFANSAGDSVDLGFYGVFSDVDTDFYTGLFRDASTGTYKLFTGLEAEPTTVVDTANGTFAYATLNAFFAIGGLVANTTNFALTANSTYAVDVVANTLSLATQLAVGSGGTGATSFTLNGVLYGNSTSAVQATSAGANGDVLQVVNNVPSFGTLDGGTF